MDFFVGGIEAEAVRGGDAGHGPEDEGDGADLAGLDWWLERGMVGAGGGIQMLEDGGDGVGKEAGGVDEREELGGGGMREVVEVNAKEGESVGLGVFTTCGSRLVFLKRLLWWAL